MVTPQRGQVNLVTSFDVGDDCSHEADEAGPGHGHRLGSSFGNDLQRRRKLGGKRRQ
jgi:hypothetical protein